MELKGGQGWTCEVVRKVRPLIEIKKTNKHPDGADGRGKKIINCGFGMFWVWGTNRTGRKRLARSWNFLSNGLCLHQWRLSVWQGIAPYDTDHKNRHCWLSSCHKTTQGRPAEGNVLCFYCVIPAFKQSQLTLSGRSTHFNLCPLLLFIQMLGKHIEQQILLRLRFKKPWEFSESKCGLEQSWEGIRKKSM